MPKGQQWYFLPLYFFGYVLFLDTFVIYVFVRESFQASQLQITI